MVVEVIELTPELARSFLDNAGPNAPLNRKKVERYKQIMLAGEWGLEYTRNGRKYLAPALSFLHGKLYNGQHRCTACVESGVTVQVRVRRDRNAQ